METFEVSAEQAMDALKIPDSERGMYLSKLVDTEMDRSIDRSIDRIRWPEKGLNTGPARHKALDSDSVISRFESL